MRTDLPSNALEKFSEKLAIPKNDVKKEIETRKVILEWMLKNNLRKPDEVLEVIQSYYFDPKKVLAMVFESDK